MDLAIAFPYADIAKCCYVPCVIVDILVLPIFLDEINVELHGCFLACLLLDLIFLVPYHSPLFSLPFFFGPSWNFSLGTSPI